MTRAALHTPPEGYALAHVRESTVVARIEHLGAVAEAMQRSADGTLHGWAAQHPHARALKGRGTVYAVPLPDGARVVVRHNQHGGLLATFTRDRYPAPTRAPRELRVALRLADRGVPTPEVVAYAMRDAGLAGRLARSEVATREVAHSIDLAAALAEGQPREQRQLALDAAAQLVSKLAEAGARHHDLNLKNVLLAQPEGASAPVAYVIDVDRVTFHSAGTAALLRVNLTRLLRSARKWRDRWGAPITDAELQELVARASA